MGKKVLFILMLCFIVLIVPVRAADIDTRLTKLETKVQLKFDEVEKALVLARDLADKDRIFEKERQDVKWLSNTEYYRRLEKLEQSIATREQLDEVRRLVWIGIGILMALQFGVFVFFKKNGKE